MTVGKVGRNDPCPCGSGKKYKKCCLLAAGVSSAAWTRAERESVQMALGRFGWRHEFDEDRAAAEIRFWQVLDVLPYAKRPEIVEQGEAFFQDWFTTDRRLASGHTLIELFLEREGDRLRSGERRYLERARLSHLRPYEVLDVRADEGFDLLDLWTGSRLGVQERLGTRQIVQWDVVATRVILGPDGVPVLDGIPYLFPARAKDDLVRDLRRVHRRFRKEVAGDDVDFFKRFGSVFFAFWVQHVARPLPALHTTEGDELAVARAVFDVADREALERALAGHADLERQDDGSYTWFEPGSGDDFRRILGTFVVEDGRVTLEAMSRERADRGRALLESLAGATVRHRATICEDIEGPHEHPDAEGPRQDEGEEEEVPDAIAAGLIGAHYERHYRTWPDTGLPALRGQTPRQAAASKTGRPKVVALLKDMESFSARERLAGRPAYDFDWMWTDLGLERPS